MAHGEMRLDTGRFEDITPATPEMESSTLEAIRPMPCKQMGRLPIRTGTPTLPNQSYLVKQMQAKMTAALSVLMYDLGAACFNPPHPWQNPNSVLTYTSGWRREHQNFVITGSPFPNVTFTGARWDPENGKVNYGLKKVAKDAVKQDDGLTKIIRNDTDGDIHVSYSQAISLTNSFSSSITKGLNEDLEVSSETTVSGEYAGVSAEEKLGVSFGIEKTSEESKEESQEGTRDEALAIDFDAEARKYYLITILKEQGNFYQAFRHRRGAGLRCPHEPEYEDMAHPEERAPHIASGHFGQGRRGRPAPVRPRLRHRPPAHAGLLGRRPGPREGCGQLDRRPREPPHPGERPESGHPGQERGLPRRAAWQRRARSAGAPAGTRTLAREARRH